MTEAAFTSQVIALCRLWGWKVAHFRAAQTARGWRTPVQGDGAGFPDLVLVRPAKRGVVGRLVWAELKTDTGRLSAEQERWLDALKGAGQEAYVWRPEQWDTIQQILGGQG